MAMFKKEPLSYAICVVCGMRAGLHPVVRPTGGPCIGCYEDEDLIQVLMTQEEVESALRGRISGTDKIESR